MSFVYPKFTVASIKTENCLKPGIHIRHFVTKCIWYCDLFTLVVDVTAVIMHASKMHWNWVLSICNLNFLSGSRTYRWCAVKRSSTCWIWYSQIFIYRHYIWCGEWKPDYCGKVIKSYVSLYRILHMVTHKVDHWSMFFANKLYYNLEMRPRFLVIYTWICKR